MYRNDFVRWLDDYYDREVLNKKQEPEPKKSETAENEGEEK